MRQFGEEKKQKKKRNRPKFFGWDHVAIWIWTWRKSTRSASDTWNTGRPQIRPPPPSLGIRFWHGWGFQNDSGLMLAPDELTRWTAVVRVTNPLFLDTPPPKSLMHGVPFPPQRAFCGAKSRTCFKRSRYCVLGGGVRRSQTRKAAELSFAGLRHLHLRLLLRALAETASFRDLSRDPKEWKPQWETSLCCWWVRLEAQTATWVETRADGLKPRNRRPCVLFDPKELLTQPNVALGTTLGHTNEMLGPSKTRPLHLATWVCFILLQPSAFAEASPSWIQLEAIAWGSDLHVFCEAVRVAILMAQSHEQQTLCMFSRPRMSAHVLSRNRSSSRLIRSIHGSI